MTGSLSYMLGNRVYLGEINHQGESYAGEHEAVIDAELLDAVQKIKEDGLNRTDVKRGRSGAPLLGLIFDDRGNHMTPVHVTKHKVRYRYYQSWVLAHGQKSKAGSVNRVPAGDIEMAVSDAVKIHIGPQIHGTENPITDVVTRIEIHPAQFVMTLGGPAHEDSKVFIIPWSKPSSIRKREILGNRETGEVRPIRSKARTRLIKGIAQGRLWLNYLVDKKVHGLAELAAKYSVSEKTVRSTISLAFLAPDIVQAAIDGRLPRGMGISQMTDLAANWNEQRKQLGLSEPHKQTL